MNAYAIQTTDLVKAYGARRALDGFSLAVPTGCILGLVGPNGAGKTTWMMTVAGFLRPRAGKIDLLGEGPFDADVHAGRITILPQDSELPLASRPLELLSHFGRLQGLRKQEAGQSARRLLETLHLGDRVASPIRTLSHGMRKRVMLAQCFIGYPEVVLLDEPLSGLDPREAAHARAFIAARKTKQTIVISSHDLHDIEQVCTHVAYVEKGHVARFGALRELTRKDSLLRFFLTAEPSNLEALRQACPGGELRYDETHRVLSCSFDGNAQPPEEINARLLPALLAQTGLLAIERGDSLEKAYLRDRS